MFWKAEADEGDTGKLTAKFTLLFLFFVFSLLFFISSISSVQAGTQHGVNGLVRDALDNTSANGAEVTFTISRGGVYCTLRDIVGTSGNSEKSNWYAVDVGNCAVQWEEDDLVEIFIFKDAEHNASTEVDLTNLGNDQAPTIKLSAPGYPEEFCGDDICQPPENSTTCPQDCSIDCGNGICDPGEPGICLIDCHCGNDICEPFPPFYETNVTCPQDCIEGYEGVFCGNGICESEIENQIICPQDCALLCNNNGICEFGEFYVSCPGDCDVYCGNTVCDTDLNETEETCPSDCGEVVCGDNFCDTSLENWQNCPSDCYSLFAKCGDLTCELAETSRNCCFDCGCEELKGVWTILKTSDCERNKCIEKWRWWLLLFLLPLLLLLLRRKKFIKKKAILLKSREGKDGKGGKGGEAVIKVILEIKNIFRKSVKDIKIVDRFPNITKLHRLKVKPNKKSGNKLEWDFKSMEPGQKKTISYTLHLKMPHITKLLLPKALSSFIKVDKSKKPAKPAKPKKPSVPATHAKVKRKTVYSNTVKLDIKHLKKQKHKVFKKSGRSGKPGLGKAGTSVEGVSAAGEVKRTLSSIYGSIRKKDVRSALAGYEKIKKSHNLSQLSKKNPEISAMLREVSLYSEVAKARQLARTNKLTRPQLQKIASSARSVARTIPRNRAWLYGAVKKEYDRIVEGINRGRIKLGR